MISVLQIPPGAGRMGQRLASSGPAPAAGQTDVMGPSLPLGDIPKYNKEYKIVRQSQKFHLREAAKFFPLVCKKCFFNSVWNNLINWLTRQHLATSREIFYLNLLLFWQNWKLPFWHKATVVLKASQGFGGFSLRVCSQMWIDGLLRCCFARFSPSSAPAAGTSRPRDSSLHCRDGIQGSAVSFGVVLADPQS